MEGVARLAGDRIKLTFEKDSPRVAGGTSVNGEHNRHPGFPPPTPFNSGGGTRSNPHRMQRFPGGLRRGGFSSTGDAG